MTSVVEAKSLARDLLAEELPRRWAHTRGVAAQARRLAPGLGADAEVVEAAAWLHDIGYASKVAASGFHPLDGARYLRETRRADEIVCRLVAHHTCAVIEARERGIGALLDEFAVPNRQLLDALTYCDLTADVDGRTVAVEERLGEILRRYPPDHVVHRSIRRARPCLLRAASDVRRRLADF
ncbi:HD domain-containing protein [Kribbella sp. CA-293567]|uniref:HD domain-containing protein n=1 Tax=Kribbella sp. CA-293567 TaxID=3002436 RepID=UPI0022DD2BC9|nr:HD domain-containing protein [Kribbella sp. CA-293567]WBQ04346.1 HD domain-containing protein [Kribbella sp. CA-293567]